MKKLVVILGVIFATSAFAQNNDTSKFYINVKVVKLTKNKTSKSVSDTTDADNAIRKAIKLVEANNGIDKAEVIIPVKGTMFVEKKD